MIDSSTRSELNRCLSKIIAYKNAGNDKEARVWAITLVGLLNKNGVNIG